MKTTGGSSVIIAKLIVEKLNAPVFVKSNVNLNLWITKLYVIIRLDLQS